MRYMITKGSYYDDVLMDKDLIKYAHICLPCKNKDICTQRNKLLRSYSAKSAKLGVQTSLYHGRIIHFLNCHCLFKISLKPEVLDASHYMPYQLQSLYLFLVSFKLFPRLNYWSYQCKIFCSFQSSVTLVHDKELNLFLASIYPLQHTPLPPGLRAQSL